MPCKHLAAVIYLISRQIDSDPFLVFALHGLDLPTALRQRGMDIDKKIFITPPSLSALFANQPFVHEEKANQGLDFTLIPALHHDLLRLLPDNPVFYPFGDFHQVYSQQLARLVRYGEQLQKIVPESESQMQWALGATESPMLRIDGDYRCCVQGITHLKDLSTLLGAEDFYPANLLGYVATFRRRFTPGLAIRCSSAGERRSYATGFFL